MTAHLSRRLPIPCYKQSYSDMEACQTVNQDKINSFYGSSAVGIALILAYVRVIYVVWSRTRKYLFFQLFTVQAVFVS